MKYVFLNFVSENLVLVDKMGNKEWKKRVTTRQPVPAVVVKFSRGVYSIVSRGLMWPSFQPGNGHLEANEVI